MMKLITDIGYDNSFSFIFSPRPGTPAANLEDDTPHEVKLKRLQRLQAVIDANTRRYSDEMVGSVQRILVEGPAKKEAGDLQGRTENNRVVNFAGGPNADRLIGQMIDVNITQSHGYTPCAAKSSSNNNQHTRIAHFTLKTKTPFPSYFTPEPLDNKRLAHLCGPMDENLRQISAALDVTIFRRGEKFIVSGSNAARG
jgi:hypothetical protein